MRTESTYTAKEANEDEHVLRIRRHLTHAYTRTECMPIQAWRSLGNVLVAERFMLLCLAGDSNVFPFGVFGIAVVSWFMDYNTLPKTELYGSLQVDA